MYRVALVFRLCLQLFFHQGRSNRTGSQNLASVIVFIASTDHRVFLFVLVIEIFKFDLRPENDLILSSVLTSTIVCIGKLGSKRIDFWLAACLGFRAAHDIRILLKVTFALLRRQSFPRFLASLRFPSDRSLPSCGCRRRGSLERNLPCFFSFSGDRGKRKCDRPSKCPNASHISLRFGVFSCIVGQRQYVVNGFRWV